MAGRNICSTTANRFRNCCPDRASAGPTRTVMRFAAVLLLFVASTARADTSYPMIMAVRPVAVQAGKTGECEFESRYNLHGAYKVLVTGSGVVGEVDPPMALKP